VLAVALDSFQFYADIADNLLSPETPALRGNARAEVAAAHMGLSSNGVTAM
jgi:hypothetical protein